MSQSLFEKLGGEARLRAIIDVFIDRVFEDRMIGFFFRKAHVNHPIMGGHFARRRQILKETLEANHVAEEIQSAWLRHTDSLRPLITPEPGSACDPVAARERVK